MKPWRRYIGFLYALYKVLTFQYKESIKRHRNSERIITIYFHNISTNKFEQLLKWIIKCKFTLINQDDLIEFLYSRKNIKGGVLITFDDGWKGNLDLIPIIEKYNCPILIFLSTRAIFNKQKFWPLIFELYFGHRVDSTFHNLSYKEKLKLIEALESLQEFSNIKSILSIKEAKILGSHPLVSFGMHSHNHISLVNCTQEEIKQELNLNLRFIKQLYPYQVKSFAYPYGLTDSDNQKILEAINISIAMITGNKTINKSCDKYLIPRYGFSDATLLENYCKILDCWTFNRR